MELRCTVQNYAWGKRCSSSKVAQLIQSTNPEFIPKEDEPYAELWMGTHPSGPSTLKDLNISLDKYITEKDFVLGNGIKDTFGVQLPFLFKVLSVNVALSIQVHPNKEQAESLHRTFPNIYKDPNHKPELAIALTPFEALCGFRPISEIKNYLKIIPELCAAIGDNKTTTLISSDESTLRDSLKNCFASLMSQNKEIIAKLLYQFLDRLSKLDKNARKVLNADLFERLHKDYPGDVGCFVIYFLNYMTLQPGEAIYLQANEVHAYLSGDCIECMACSDNVVRAGLTPKLIDVETLINIASFSCQSAEAKKFQALEEDECTRVFRPSIQDFAVAQIAISPGRSYNTVIRNSASILILINGKVELSDGRNLKSGSVLFLPASESLKMIIPSDSESVLIFQAFANIS